MRNGPEWAQQRPLWVAASCLSNTGGADVPGFERHFVLKVSNGSVEKFGLAGPAMIRAPQ